MLWSHYSHISTPQERCFVSHRVRPSPVDRGRSPDASRPEGTRHPSVRTDRVEETGVLETGQLDRPECRRRGVCQRAPTER